MPFTTRIWQCRQIEALHQLNLPPAECKTTVTEMFIQASDKQVLAMQTNLKFASAQPAACRMQDNSQ